MSNSSTNIGNSEGSAPPKTPAYWVFLPGLAVSTYVLVEASPHASAYHGAIELALLVFVPGFAGPLFRALGQTVLSSVCAVIVIGSYWTISFLLLFWSTAESVVALLYVSIFFVPALGFAIAATISLARRLRVEWAFSTVGVGFLCGVIGAATFLAAKRSEVSWERALDPVVLAPDMIAIDKCSQEFAASHSETGYPESLEQLGPQGSDCVPEALLKGQYKGFTISYEPGPKDADGKVAAYAVKARETSPKGQEVSSMFSDESGRIHYRFDGPHGMGTTIAYFPGQDTFSQLLDCLWDASLNSTFRFIDEHGDRVVTDRDLYVRHRLWEHPFTDKRKFSSGGHNFAYGFTSENDGTINGFTVDVRPQQYGISGIRSYLAVATIDLRTSRHSFNIHATPQNRSATLADPMTQPGEIKPPGYLSSEKPNN
jgi:hypothetical protein